MQRDSEFLATEKPSKLLLKLALPAVTAQLVNMLYNIVDRMYIGRLEGIGTEALAGVGACLPVILLVSAFAALASMGGAPRASIFMGQGLSLIHISPAPRASRCSAICASPRF